MKKIVMTTSLGALMAVTAYSSAYAEDRWPNWYIGLTGGYSLMSDQDVSGNTTATKIGMHSGYDVGGSIGYLPASSIPLVNALRFELEVNYHQNDIHDVSYTNGGRSTAGNFDSVSYMINTFYDLPLQSQWSPYVGAGLGIDTIHLSANSGVGNTSENVNDLAYQLMAGIGYSPVTIPNTQWTVGYRYMAAIDTPTFDGASGDVKAKYSANSVELGAKFRF